MTWIVVSYTVEVSVTEKPKSVAHRRASPLGSLRISGDGLSATLECVTSSDMKGNLLDALRRLSEAVESGQVWEAVLPPTSSVTPEPHG